MEPVIRFLHVTGAILFLGTLFVNYRIKSAAEKDGRSDILSFAYKLIRKNDVALSLPGLLLIVGCGLGLVGVFKAAVMRPWLFASLGLMLGVLGGWMGGIIPAQIALSKIDNPELSQEAVKKASGRWNMGWWVTMISTMLILLFMIARGALL